MVSIHTLLNLGIPLIWFLGIPIMFCIFVRNEVADIEAGKSSRKQLRDMYLPYAIISLFWPACVVVIIGIAIVQTLKKFNVVLTFATTMGGLVKHLGKRAMYGKTYKNIGL